MFLTRRTGTAVTAAAIASVGLLAIGPATPVAANGALSHVLTAVSVTQGGASRSLYGSDVKSSQMPATAAEVVGPLPATVSGVHYLYAQDGTCGDAGGDGIDVFSVSGNQLTHIQQVAIGCAGSDTIYGSTEARHIGVAAANSTHGACLVFAPGAGYQPQGGIGLGPTSEEVYSFTIDGQGMLSPAPASKLELYPSFGSEVLVSPNGNTVYFASDPYEEVNAASLGAGCSLQWLATTSTAPYSDAGWQFLAPNELVTVETNGPMPGSANYSSPGGNHVGDLDFYRLGPGGAMTLVASAPGQISNLAVSAPMGLDVLTTATSLGAVTNVYTGQTTYSPPEEAQGFQATPGGSVTHLTPVPVQATDPAAVDGGTVLTDPNNLLLLQADQGNWWASPGDPYWNCPGQGIPVGCPENTTAYLGRIAWHSLTVGSPGSPGSIVYGGDVPTATNDGPDSMAEVGNVLFVGMAYKGDLEACAVGTSGVSACGSVATLTGAGRCDFNICIGGGSIAVMDAAVPSPDVPETVSAPLLVVIGSTVLSAAVVIDRRRRRFGARPDSA